MKFFIATYTNKVKQYCDKKFFDNLYSISKGNPVMIVDNTTDDGQYTDRIDRITEEYENFDIHWIIVPVEPKRTQFLRNVEQSVNLCRDEFLKSDCDHMLVIESDVIPPDYVLEKLEDDVKNLPDNWGAIGCIYYVGFHDFEESGVMQTHHCLSGCTLYNRKLVKEQPFRWSHDNLGAFPDAWISIDAQNKGYTLWNDHDIICDHIEISPGNRGHGNL